MKAKIKKTGEIINIAEHAEIELDICNSYGNPVSVSPEDIELIQESPEDIDWEQRRYEIAKAAIQGYCANSNRSILLACTDTLADWSLSCADALIEKLKKK